MKGRILIFVVVAALLAGFGCTETVEPPPEEALAGFEVTLVDASELGVAPYDFPASFTPVTISVEALLADGGLKRDYVGTVQVRVVPGEIADHTRLLSLTDGVNPAHEIQLRYSFAEARIWVEEVGLDQHDECRDGFDNDGNGRIDYPGDPGCFGLEDPSEGGATYLTGLSEAIDFSPVDIRNVQFNPEDARGGSPLLGEEVVVERGELLVTNVTFNGLFVTDLAETEGYDSIFLFNFNYPEGVRLGDRLLWFSGGVDEFVGGTQLTFPSWEVDQDYELTDAVREQLARCETIQDDDVLQVEPYVLSAADLNNLDVLETLESSVVRVENVEIVNRFMDCDTDQSGRIAGIEEEACRDICQESNRCTELSNFIARDQFGGNVAGSTVYISGANQIVDFDAFEGCEQVETEPPTYDCPDRVLASATGNLRHVFLTTRIQLWELVPRFTCDLQFACESNADCFENQTCTNSVCN